MLLRRDTNPPFSYNVPGTLKSQRFGSPVLCSWRHATPMTDAQVETIRRQVELYLRRNRLDIGKKAELEKLVVFLASMVGSGVGNTELRVVAAMCLLGPGSASSTDLFEAGESPGAGFPVYRGAQTVPPQLMIDAVLSLLKRFAERGVDDPSLVFDVVVAYGCGNWRDLFTSPTPWAGRWIGAVRAITRFMIPAIHGANQWFADRVVGCVSRGQDQLWGDAILLTEVFINPIIPMYLPRGRAIRLVCKGQESWMLAMGARYTMPAGAKIVLKMRDGAVVESDGRKPVSLGKDFRLVIAARDDELHVLPNGAIGGGMKLAKGGKASIQGPVSFELWSCRCGWSGCEKCHRLEAWEPRDPSKTLAKFVALAVIGPGGRMHTRSFPQSIYYPHLASEGFS